MSLLLGGSLQLHGSTISLACFHGLNFKSKSWALFSLAEPLINFTSEVQSAEETHVVQNMIISLGESNKKNFYDKKITLTIWKKTFYYKNKNFYDKKIYFYDKIETYTMKKKLELNFFFIYILSFSLKVIFHVWCIIWSVRLVSLTRDPFIDESSTQNFFFTYLQLHFFIIFFTDVVQKMIISIGLG